MQFKENLIDLILIIFVIIIITTTTTTIFKVDVSVISSIVEFEVLLFFL